MPGFKFSSSSSSNVLADVSINLDHFSHRPHDMKYPPGLGHGTSHCASDLHPSPVSLHLGDAPTPKHTRRRSGTFTYVSGSAFSTGNISPSRANGLSTLTSPVSFAQSPSRPGKRTAGAAGLSRLSHISPSSQFRRLSDTSSLPPPVRSPQGSRFFEVTSAPKFDPFGCDDTPSPPASSTSYSHFWEYDPATNGPKLCSSAPQRPSNAPYTVKTPPAPTNSLPSPPSSASSSSPFVPSLPSDNNARSKLVAGILLNRIHIVGKPMRRGSGMLAGLQKEYVKSGLSSVITVEC